PGHDRVGHVRVEWLFTMRLTRPQHVQADAGDDGGQPGAKIVDVIGTRPGDSNPGLLEGVVGICLRAKNAVRYSEQVGPVRLEPLHQPLVVAHVTSLRSRLSLD